MKRLYKSIFALVICSITLSINNLSAQELYASQPQGERDCVVGRFAALNVSNSLDVTVQEGRCGVKLHADEALIPYIKVEVRDSTLFIEYDTKALPTEVKKIYRGHNAPVPILRASVSIPALNGLTASQNAYIHGNGTVFSDNIEINLTDKAAIKDLNLDASYAKIRMNKNAQADFTVSSESQLELSLEGSSQLKLHYKAHNLLLYQAGNSTSILTGESPTATFDILGSSKSRLAHKGNVLVLYAGGYSDVSLSGEMGDLTLSAERSAKIDGLEMTARRVMASLNGWTRANVHADEFLSVDLTGGSTLYYSGVPAIQVEQVIKSTLAPYLVTEKQ